MPQTFLLVEGINIYANVLDTDQLSVIRGSGFILKQAIDTVAKSCMESLTAISTGASSGLFEVRSGHEPKHIVNQIKTLLAQKPYCFFTFAIESCQAESLLLAKERLITQMRFHQMAGISVVPDHLDTQHSPANQPCQLEGRRVAVTQTDRMVQGRQRQLSLSTYHRLLHGRKLRQGLYFSELDTVSATSTEIADVAALKQYGFVDDLESLAASDIFPKLKGKIAVLYLDGNKFSRIQRDLIEAAQDQVKAQQAFDHKVKTYRANFLKQTLLAMTQGEAHYPQAIHHSDEKDSAEQESQSIRLETLLWGGDESIVVVPAWLGFQLLQSFFEFSADWNVEQDDGKKTFHLTHAAGLVFCHAKTPIRIIRSLAEQLANRVKEKLGDGEQSNAWDYMVLESIDYPVDDDLDQFYAERYGAYLSSQRPLPLKPCACWAELRNELSELFNGEHFSRRQLYRITSAAIEQQAPAGVDWPDLALAGDQFPSDASPQDLAERRMLLLIDAKQRSQIIKQLERLATEVFAIDLNHNASRAWFWLNLVELWDYLVPAEEQE